MMRGQREKARQVIAKYQTTSGSLDEPIVDIVTSQIEESLETSRTGLRQSWNFGVFVTKTVRYRLLVLVLYSMFQSWNGGGLYPIDKLWICADPFRYCVVLSHTCAQDGWSHQAYNTAWCKSRSDCDILCVHRHRRMVCRLLQAPDAHLCWPRWYRVHADGGYDYFLAVQPETDQCNLGSHHHVDVHVPGHQRHNYRNDVSATTEMAGLLADVNREGTISTQSRFCLCPFVQREWVYTESSKARAVLSKRTESRLGSPRWDTKSGVCTSYTTCSS